MVCADMAAGTNWRITDTKLMNIGYTFDEAAMIVATATVGDCSALSTVHRKRELGVSVLLATRF